MKRDERRGGNRQEYFRFSQYAGVLWMRKKTHTGPRGIIMGNPDVDRGGGLKAKREDMTHGPSTRLIEDCIPIIGSHPEPVERT